MLNVGNLATVRTLHGLSQRQLADLIGVSQPYIAQAESGSRSLSDSLRAKVTAALDLKPDKMAQIAAVQAQMDDLRASISK